MRSKMDVVSSMATGLDRSEALPQRTLVLLVLIVKLGLASAIRGLFNKCASA